MRQILVDWLVEVHLKFKLLPETLFLTVNLIDRFTKFKQVKRNDYQLLGVTAMLVACKYEEIYAPEIRDFIYMTDKAYSKEQILLMERDILQTLDFNITAPSPYRFLERFIKLSGSDDLIMNFSRYMIELTLIETSMYKWKPS
jgi:cyclin B